MEVHVNIIAVLLATVAAMVVGFVWYVPVVFGKVWMKLAGLQDAAKRKKSMFVPMLCSVLGSLVTAFILAHVSYLSYAFFGGGFFKDAVSTAFWLALGISATTLVIHNSFEQKPWKLTLLAIGNRFVTLIAMGAVIGWLKP